MDGYFINLDVLPKLPLMLLSSNNYALHFFTIITVQLLLYSFSDFPPEFVETCL